MSDDMWWLVGIIAYLCAGLTVGLVLEYRGFVVDDYMSRGGRLMAYAFVWPIIVAVGIFVLALWACGRIGDEVLGPENQ